MALYGKKPEFEQPSSGSVPAVLAFINDIGMQTSDFNGTESVNHQAVFTFEINEANSKGENFLISKFYNLLIGRKSNLRKDIESWFGKSLGDEEMEKLDLETLIGKGVLLNIGLSATGKAKVVGLSPLVKGMETMVPTYKEMPESLKNFIDKKRMESVKEPF